MEGKEHTGLRTEDLLPCRCSAHFPSPDRALTMTRRGGAACKDRHGEEEAEKKKRIYSILPLQPLPRAFYYTDGYCKLNYTNDVDLVLEASLPRLPFFLLAFTRPPFRSSRVQDRPLEASRESSRLGSSGPSLTLPFATACQESTAASAPSRCASMLVMPRSSFA